MPSNPNNRIFRRIEVKLTVWYALIFIVSWLGLFLAGFFILETSILHRDRQIVTGLIEKYGLDAETKGAAHLVNLLQQERLAHMAEGWFVMVADPEDTILHITMPHGWQDFDRKEIRALLGFDPGDFWYYMTTDRYLRMGQDETGHDELEIRVRKLVGGHRIWLGYSAESREEYLESFRDIFLWVMILVVLISAAMGGIMAWRSMAPIRALEKTVDRVVDGRIQARIPLTGREGELAGLTEQFNRMLDRNEGLIKAMKDALDNVAHDLRTPLTRMRIAIERNAMEEDSGKLKEALFDCAEESQRISRMLTTLMDISEAETGVMRLHFTPIALSSLFDEVMDIYTDTAGNKGISLVSSCPPGLVLNADPGRIKQAVCNLVDNAVKYAPAGTRITIAAQTTRDAIQIKVSDMGMGISAGDMTRIFDRLYRGDQSRSTKGLGLGLSLVKAVVQAHKGTVSVDSDPGKGSLFVLTFPLVRD